MNFKYRFKTFAKLSSMDSKVDKDLQKEVGSNMDVALDSQPDLLYFKAVYLSEGANRNGAVFHREELLPTLGSIVNKAMDIEHEEKGIVGHIYAASFADSDGNMLTKDEAKSFDGSVDVVIAGIVYRDRFGDLASEIEDGDWYVSMETYYSDYYITVGEELRLDRDHPDLEKIEEYVGQKVVVSKDGDELANDVVYRHMKGLHFCGGGFVKKPANPTSIIFETASKKDDNVYIELSESNDLGAGNDKIVIKLTASISKEDGIEPGNDLIDLSYVETYISELIEDNEMKCRYSVAFDSLRSTLSRFDKEVGAKWTRAYINKLPDSAFVIIEPAYSQGKTDNKNARHLPYKDSNGKVDPAHLRNAAARCSQIKAVTDSITTESLRKKACAKVQKLVKKHLGKK
jgi:hypothetical protein